MREIKFRAFNQKTKKMFYVGWFMPLVIGDESKWTIHNDANTLEPKEVASDCDSVLMEFTGLKDKNGVGVYEGDIFQFGTKKEWRNGEGERGVVEWHEKLARFGLTFYSIYGGEGYTGKSQHLVDLIKGLKIIGNIYENLDLLKS